MGHLGRTSSFIFLLILGITSCGGGRQSSGKRSYGKMTVSDLIREKGTPLKDVSIPDIKGRMLHYQDEESFQVRGEMVINSFRKPTKAEATVLYWKNFFKDCDTSERVLSTGEHGIRELELACASKGFAVIYTEGSEYVSRVVENAPQ